MTGQLFRAPGCPCTPECTPRRAGAYKNPRRNMASFSEDSIPLKDLGGKFVAVLKLF